MSVRQLGAKHKIAMPEFVHRMSIRADIGVPIEIAGHHSIKRVIFPIIGGQVLGADFSGSIIPNGADFARELPDGSFEVAARYCIVFDDKTVVMVSNAGRLYAQPDGSYRGHTRAVFEAPEGNFAWLSSGIFLGSALAEPEDEERVFIELWQPILPGAGDFGKE